MADATPRLSLPLLASGQAQKELFHNEALALVDIALQPVAQAGGATIPPASPQPGQCWILGSGATGDWAGHDLSLAGWTSGGWRFVAANAGMQVWSLADGVFLRFDGSAWLAGEVVANHVVIAGDPVLGPRRPAITAPAGGAVVDIQARAAISDILATLVAHGLIGA